MSNIVSFVYCVYSMGSCLHTVHFWQNVLKWLTFIYIRWHIFFPSVIFCLFRSLWEAWTKLTNTSKQYASKSYTFKVTEIFNFMSVSHLCLKQSISLGEGSCFSTIYQQCLEQEWHLSNAAFTSHHLSLNVTLCSRGL